MTPSNAACHASQAPPGMGTVEALPVQLAPLQTQCSVWNGVWNGAQTATRMKSQLP